MPVQYLEQISFLYLLKGREGEFFEMKVNILMQNCLNKFQKLPTIYSGLVKFAVFYSSGAATWYKTKPVESIKVEIRH